MFRNFLLDKRSNYLQITESVPVDDQFSSPKQCNWSAALVKVLVVQNSSSTGYIGLRYPDLSFYSKWFDTNYSKGETAIDSDSTYSYSYCTNTARIAKVLLTNTIISDYVARTDILNNIRMIDFASDSTYGYVTSNNATDGHGVRKVRKSDMTVVASLLATGTGDGQFTNPLGIKKYGDCVYVCDTSNNRVVVLNASDLSYSFKYDVAFAIQDIVTDGSYWYSVAVDGTLRKRDMSFSSPNVAVISSSGYSLCIIPDDGINGATLCVVSSTNSNIKRHKCSDLSLITTVGSSGDGSTSLCDPEIKTSVSCTCVWQWDDLPAIVTTGTTHAPSMNGFTGIFHRYAGPHKCRVWCSAGLGAITAIDANTDAITQIKNLRKIVKLTSLNIRTNSYIVESIENLPSTITYLSIYLDTYISGDLSKLPAFLEEIYAQSCPALTGSLSSLPATTKYAHLHSNSFAAASIAHLVAIRDLRIYSMGWTAQQNTDVLLSAWGARANYTYASNIVLRIGAPTGTLGTEPPEEGASNSDWSWNAGTSRHDPLTGYAAISDLQTDFYGEGFKPWVVTIV